MMNQINRIRSRLKPYAEVFYMLFFLPMAGCVAMGISSDKAIYRLVFAAAMLFLLMKFIVTDYSKKEYLFMLASMILLGYVFMRTGEKALIISALAVYGCKDVSVRRVLKYTFWVYIIGMAITISLVLMGKISPHLYPLYKGGMKRKISDFGFSHPNSAYSHVLMIALMMVAVWQDRLRWYHYAGLSAVMIIAYRVFYCRTGLLIYFFLCAALILFFLIKNKKARKVLWGIYCIMPLAMAAFSYTLAVLYPKHIPIVDKLNGMVTGRIGLSNNALQSVGLTWFGTLEKPWLGHFYIDNIYMNILICCGGVVFLLVLAACFYTCLYFWKKEQYYVLIILGIVCIYGFMEYSPINATWNPLLLFMGESLFKHREVIEGDHNK